jgi:2-oxo-3-(phosphooxy)propyl 3-oxoalkanoate synthase
MKGDVSREWPLDASITLSFDRTINRGQVHRTAVSEVFLTDVRALDGQRVVLAGQLPPCHSYFSDHAHRGLALDPLLIMEVGRQATLASAHELGVPADVVLISGDFGLRITDPDAWRISDAAAGLRLDSEFTWTRIRRGQPRAGICEQRIFLDGRMAASHRSSGRLLARDELDALREAQRGTTAPRTADLADRPDPEAVPPSAVGRHDSLNVVLAGLRREGRELTARIAPRLSNRALFDHSYDHLTMQVLTEAARQLALAAVGGESGRALDSWQVIGLTGTFARFAELDAVAVARTTAPARVTGELDLPITIEQDSELIAELEVTLVRYQESS